MVLSKNYYGDVQVVKIVGNVYDKKIENIKNYISLSKEN